MYSVGTSVVFFFSFSNYRITCHSLSLPKKQTRLKFKIYSAHRLKNFQLYLTIMQMQKVEALICSFTPKFNKGIAFACTCKQVDSCCWCCPWRQNQETQGNGTCFKVSLQVYFLKFSEILSPNIFLQGRNELVKSTILKLGSQKKLDIETKRIQQV